MVAPGFLSPWHIAFLAIVLLLFFGPKRLPEIGRSLGKGMRELKESFSHDHDEDASDGQHLQLHAPEDEARLLGADEQATTGRVRQHDPVG